MKPRAGIHYQWLRWITGKTVPDGRILLGSALAHCLILVAVTFLVLSRRNAPVVVFPTQTAVARRASTAIYLPPASKGGRIQMAQKVVKPRPQKSQQPQQEFLSVGTADEGLREQARVGTRGIIDSFKFRTIYGFARFPDYRLAVQLSGEIPLISPDRLPPHYEQYVTVEITIDSEGRVAEARVVSGAVNASIQRTLLSAIHEFKYRPATREGVPVPSQCDIVIHIPT